MAAFISKDTFSSKVEQERVLNWVEISEGTIFRVTDIKSVTGKFGDTAIISIQDAEENIKKVWCPSQMYRRLQENQGKTAYFISLGQNRVKNKTYNNFDMVFQE